MALFYLPHFRIKSQKSITMSMNVRDQRLYHYEFRRPRLYNPTYNSNNVFDSLNMFIRSDLPTSMLRSSDRYSLPRPQNSMPNRSEVMDYRSNRGVQNYSTISPDPERQRYGSYLTDKDRRYLQSLEDQKIVSTELRASSRRSENPEHGRTNLSYKLEDSLSKQLHQFQGNRK